MKKTRIIDCTLREIGYQTNWNFSDKCVQSVYDYASSNGVWCIELGFCHDREADPGKGMLRYCGTEKIEIKGYLWRIFQM